MLDFDDLEQLDLTNMPLLDENEFPVDQKLQKFLSSIIRTLMFMDGGRIPDLKESAAIGVVTHLASQSLNYIKAWIKS